MKSHGHNMDKGWNNSWRCLKARKPIRTSNSIWGTRMEGTKSTVQCRRPTSKHVSEYKPPNWQAQCDINRRPLPFNARQDNAVLSSRGGELLLPFPRLSWSTQPAAGSCSTHSHKLECCSNSPGPKLFSHWKSLQPNNHLGLQHPPEWIYTLFSLAASVRKAGSQTIANRLINNSPGEFPTFPQTNDILIASKQ